MSDSVTLPSGNSVSEAVTNSLQQLLQQGQFQAAIRQYESEIANATVPIPQTWHWLYGLALLLHDQEEDAHMTWMMAMMDGDEAEVNCWTTDLGNILEQHAIFQTENANYQQAKRIRYHLREIAPQNYGNLLQILKLAIEEETLTQEQLIEFELIELLTDETASVFFAEQTEFLVELLRYFLSKAVNQEFIDQFILAIQTHIDQEDFINILFDAAIKYVHFRQLGQIGLSLLELCHSIKPANIEILTQIAEALLSLNQYKRAKEIGQAISAQADNIVAKVRGSYYTLKACLSDSQERSSLIQQIKTHESYLEELIQEHPVLSYVEARYIISSVHLLTYVNDNPQCHRVLQNRILVMAEKAIQTHWHDAHQKFQQGHKQRISAFSNNIREVERPLRIGYICSCFYSHSVGWLARALMLHQDETKFDIYIYGVNIPPHSHHVTRFYQQNGFNYRSCGFDSNKIAEQIFQDQIDILVDLDSITRDTVFTVMAMRPAPIQATWLGWDAAGISSIDYYIADNYSLPENAQDYYIEKIWRLPNAFIAVDGFEVGMPTIRRSDLNIPEDAIIFFNPQRGYKLSQEVLRYQLQILKETPNSYLLLKGVSTDEALEELIGSLAKSVGVSLDRLRPIPIAATEEIHRANLAIADVILDTFPYNGATTTTEALWMEIPIVTLVGQQFSARNSYALMQSAGINEGISWTPEEYIDWGIRMGTDAALRQQVAWKLRQGKRSAPLWNGKAFAQEMEAAYRQMYQQYIAAH